MDFRIKYAYGQHADKEIVVRNCMSDLHAKIRLNDYCKRKYGDGELRVFDLRNNEIYDAFGGIFGDIFK